MLNVLSFQKNSFVVKTFEDFSPCTLHNGCALLHNRIFLLNTHTMPASKQTHSYICLQDKRKSFTIENTSIGLLECMRLMIICAGKVLLKECFLFSNLTCYTCHCLLLHCHPASRIFTHFTKRKESNAFLVPPEF